jgi:hypothetical protein
MPTPDPESLGLLSKVVGAATAVLVPVWGFVKLYDKKADKASVKADFQEVRDELATQRGHIAKVFDQIRENEQRAQDRHERLMERLK